MQLPFVAEDALAAPRAITLVPGLYCKRKARFEQESKWMCTCCPPRTTALPGENIPEASGATGWFKDQPKRQLHGSAEPLEAACRQKRTVKSNPYISRFLVVPRLNAGTS